MYATPHVIAQLSEAGTPVPLKIVHRQVLTPAQAADVDYALSFDNVPGGTAYPEAAWDRSIIAKTGTTNNAQSAFFIGSIPQYSLAVGMFTQNQSDHTSRPSTSCRRWPTRPPADSAATGRPPSGTSS